MQLTVRMPDEYTEKLNVLSNKDGAKKVGCCPPGT